MEDLWKRAKCFAEEAAKKSHTLTNPSTTIADLFSETANKSKDFAAQASKKADQIKIKIAFSVSSPSSSIPHSQSELEMFGVTDDLRDFVRGLTSSTFHNFHLKPGCLRFCVFFLFPFVFYVFCLVHLLRYVLLENVDEVEASDVPNLASNVRKDLNEFQEKHANLVLTTVKEISRLRYELCPRFMKERHFWKIYFTLVNSHVAPFEKKYLGDVQLKEAAGQKEDNKVEPTSVIGETGKDEAIGENVKSKSSKSSSTEQELDSFLLGDIEDSDEGPDDGEGSFDDDFDKIENSDFEEEKHANRISADTV